MSSRLIHGLVLFAAVFILYGIVCFWSVATAQDNAYNVVPCRFGYDYDKIEECIEIDLPCTEYEKYRDAGWYWHPCKKEKIAIPNGRPIYAFFVNGFDQNHNFDMFHFYNFAQHIFKSATDIYKKAYVHFAWWNNLLAPYMEKPLHNAESLPSGPGGALDAGDDYFGFTYDPFLDPYGFVPSKAIPAEDYQFQKDARAVLMAIHAENPGALIILVGHSMGGDAVIRLADSMPTDFPIALLAPIDPVGNRTCLPSFSSDMDPVGMDGNNTTCNGAFNFTRFQATHTDQYWSPDRISFEDNNIGYLYHRWQTEFMFPFDYGCPNYPLLCGSQKHMKNRPPDEANLPDRYLFRQNGTRKTHIGKDNHNVQARMPTSLRSGDEGWPPWWCQNCGGWIDGHGEIVGFRGVAPFTDDSYPVALKAQGDWPRRGGCEESKSDAECRVYHLRAWEDDEDHLEKNRYSPNDPSLCKVSGDLSHILDWIMGKDSKVNQPPVADANGPYQSECEGASTTVSLDGSGSSDPEGSILSYLWHNNCPKDWSDKYWSHFDDQNSATPVLTVNTSNGCAVDCYVEVDVRDNLGNKTSAAAKVSIGDTVPPNISCPTNTTIECNESTDPSNTGEVTVTDLCDPEPDVTFTDVFTPGLCPEGCTITRTWAVTDCSENTSSCVQTIEVVDSPGGVKNKYYRDADEDGYGVPNNTTWACSKPSGYATNNSDCDDTDPNEHPDQIWYKDTDSDGYSDGSTNTVSCTRPIGFRAVSELTATSGDCDDSDQNQYPGAPEVCNGEDDNCDTLEDGLGCLYNKAPPEADAGLNQTVVEGETITLDGSKSSDPDIANSIVSYQWTQLGGIPVTLSDPTAAKPTFVTPIVYPAGMILTFELAVKDGMDLQDSNQVTIIVNDNGITGFPDDVLTMTCSTGKEIGIKVESDLVSITTIDMATIPDSSDKPDNLPYGLFDLLIKTDAVGGTAKVTFYLESKAGDNDKWSKYKDSTGEWEDCSAYLSCNAPRDQFTITLVDGGDGDDDNTANGWIVDPSGLGSSAPTMSSGGGGSGCFIETLRY